VGASVSFNGVDGPAVYTVSVRANHGDGGTATDSTTVTVNNVAPTITAFFQVAPIPEGSVSTSGNMVAQATDPAGSNDPLTFTFDCDNEGSYETPANPSTSAADCFFDDNGSYTVGVKVTDGDGGEDTATAIAVVTNVSPTAFLSNGGPVDEGSTGSVSFSAQFDPSMADTTAGFMYAYDFDNDGTFELGDGTYSGGVSGGTATAPASYLADGPGTRTVKGRILDKDGSLNDYTTTITSITSRLPLPT
jgi:hypothetical protein